MLIRIKDTRIIVYGLIDSTDTGEDANKYYRNESLLNTAIHRDANNDIYLLFRNGNNPESTDKLKLSNHIQYGFVLNGETIVNEMTTEGEGDPTPNIINADDFITAYDEAVQQVSVFFLSRASNSASEWIGYFLQYGTEPPILTKRYSNVGDLTTGRYDTGRYTIPIPEGYTEALVFATPTGDEAATPRSLVSYVDTGVIMINILDASGAWVDVNGIGDFGFPIKIQFFNI